MRLQRSAIFAGSRSGIADDLCTIGNVELKIALIHLSERRIGSVPHSEIPGHQNVTLRHLDAHDIDDDLDALYSLCDIPNLDRYRCRSWKRYAMIIHALMNGANQVR